MSQERKDPTGNEFIQRDAVERIIKRAAELDNLRSGQLTVDEVRALAREVGISSESLMLALKEEGTRTRGNMPGTTKSAPLPSWLRKITGNISRFTSSLSSRTHFAASFLLGALYGTPLWLAPEFAWQATGAPLVPFFALAIALRKRGKGPLKPALIAALFYLGYGVRTGFIHSMLFNGQWGDTFGAPVAWTFWSLVLGFSVYGVIRLVERMRASDVPEATAQNPEKPGSVGSGSPGAASAPSPKDNLADGSTWTLMRPARPAS